jgi:hypothetical protein
MWPTAESRIISRNFAVVEVISMAASDPDTSTLAASDRSDRAARSDRDTSSARFDRDTSTLSASVRNDALAITWPSYGESVLLASVQRLAYALWLPSRGDLADYPDLFMQASAIALAFVKGDGERFRAELKNASSGVVSSTRALRHLLPALTDLSEWWRRICIGRMGHKWESADPDFRDAEVAACTVAAFARFGLALNPTVEAGMGVTPLSLAIEFNPPLADAILNLAPDCGQTVNDAAIGLMNHHVCAYSLELFSRLLSCTNRSILSSGHVYLHYDRVQSAWRDTHVLISNIFRCTYSGHPRPDECLARAQLFISKAEPDGSGTDLTGGCADLRPMGSHSENIGPFPQHMWPQCEFRGTLDFVDNLHRWWSSDRPLREVLEPVEIAPIIARLVTLRTHLIEALFRIRTYHLRIHTTISEPLRSGDLSIHPLHAIIADYLLVPLLAPAQLHHHLIGPLPSIALPSNTLQSGTSK